MRNIVLEIAREAIEEVFTNTPTMDKKAVISQYPFLEKEQAAFVTLSLNNQLRGCIGSILPHRALIEDLIHNAKAAAFEDPRFPPLTLEEFRHVHIEVSLLTVPQRVEYHDSKELKTKIRPDIDGVILRKHGYQATFLPQVWEELTTFDSFFAHLCSKAGLYPNCLELHPEILTYQVEKFQ